MIGEKESRFFLFGWKRCTLYRFNWSYYTHSTYQPLPRDFKIQPMPQADHPKKKKKSSAISIGQHKDQMRLSYQIICSSGKRYVLVRFEHNSADSHVISMLYPTV